MRKHLSLAKKKQLQPAYECLQKAAELTPDSVGVWGTLASFSEVFFEDLQLSDEYLVKAQHAYEKSENKIPDNLAILEHYKGKTMQYRDNHQAAVIHLKKAYELAPTNYRKKEYKTALKWANEDEESTTS
jgi:tetratricopeptide (TPR) repeat protein